MSARHIYKDQLTCGWTFIVLKFAAKACLVLVFNTMFS